MKLHLFSIFVGHFFPLWIWIGIQPTKINADPADPDPQHWVTKDYFFQQTHGIKACKTVILSNKRAFAGRLSAVSAIQYTGLRITACCTYDGYGGTEV